MGAFDAQVVQERPRILGHQPRAVRCLLIELGALSVAAIVERDDPVAGAAQRAHPARIDPVGRHVGGKAVDQQHRA